MMETSSRKTDTVSFNTLLPIPIHGDLAILTPRQPLLWSACGVSVVSEGVVEGVHGVLDALGSGEALPCGVAVIGFAVHLGYYCFTGKAVEGSLIFWTP